MVFYIRFLKPPKLSFANYSRATVKALVTITSDLGESIYQADMSLWVAFVSPENDNQTILSSPRFYWKGGMRSLWIEIERNHIPQVTWPTQMVVSAHSKAVVDRLSLETIPVIVSAWSDTFDAKPNKGNSPWVMRRFEPAEEILLSIREETGDSIARHVWDGGIAMAACLSSTILGTKSPQSLTSLLHIAQFELINVIELGSGCGLVGIALATLRHKCHILLTDLPDAMDILDYNILRSKPASESKIEHRVLDWAEPLPGDFTGQHYDLILVSECTYNENSIPALVRTLSALVAQSPDAVVVLATKVRHFSERVFFDMMSDAGFVELEQRSIELPDPQKKPPEQRLEMVDVYCFRSIQVTAQPTDTSKPETFLEER